MRKTKLFFGLLIGALVLGFTACQHDGTQDVNVVNWYDTMQSGLFEGIYTYGDTVITGGGDGYAIGTRPSSSGKFSYVIGDGTTKNSNFYTLTLDFNYSKYTIKKFGNKYWYENTPIEFSGNIFTGNFTIKELGTYKNLEFKAN